MKKRKDTTRGFTLVELIVVIAILGVLAGIAVPALVGYIEKADDQSAIAECRQLVLAAQTLATERHGSNDAVPDGTAQAGDAIVTDVSSLGEKPASGSIGYIEFKGSVVIKLEYTNGGTTVLYENGEYIILAAQQRIPPSIYDRTTGETIQFDVVEFQPGMKISELRGKTFWYEGDENLEPGYYYLYPGTWLANDKAYDNLQEAIYATDSINYNKVSQQRKFRRINTEAPVQDYNWSDWKDMSRSDRQTGLQDFLQFGQFYYVEFDPNVGPVLAMYRGTQEGFTYHTYLGDIANPENENWSDYWTLASDM